ncbi:aldolase/citrate lyase family protein [Bremerella sp. JC770]|uniref:HpcH/HpaI aldolase family protein n=1 Tax=Bremerella sp. JC770 TaxID=3232137 RepID=UPI00345957C9
MNGKELSLALRQAGPVFGTLITSPSPRLPASLNGSGLDFVFLDTEHIALDRSELSWMCQVYQQLGMAPLVRIPEPNPNLATMVLDGGAAGVIAPYVETAQQVKELVGATKCRPLKGQRLKRHLNGEPLEPALKQYVDQHNAQNVLVINVESQPALDSLDEMLQVPGLDAVLVGPHDLSCSLGIPEQYDHPEFEQAVQTIIKQARARHVGAGIHFWGNMQQEIHWLRAGLNMLIHSADISLFTKQLRRELEDIQSALNPAMPQTRFRQQDVII